NYFPSSGFGGAHIQKHGDAAIDLVGWFRVGHWNGVTVAGHLSDLSAADAMFEQLAPDGSGAIGGNFPITIIRAQWWIALLRVAFQFDGEAVVTRDLPGQSGENPFSVSRERGGLGLKDGFVSAVENIDR